MERIKSPIASGIPFTFNGYRIIVGKVWTPIRNLFEEDPETIAQVFKDNSQDLSQTLFRLGFYENQVFQTLKRKTLNGWNRQNRYFSFYLKGMGNNES